MATIQVRRLPDDVADTFRRAAQASGQSLQSFMRDQLIAWARRPDQAETTPVAAEKRTELVV